MKFLKLLIFIILTFSPSFQQRCGIDLIPQTIPVTMKPLKSSRVRNLQSGPKFDIYVDYETLRHTTTITGTYFNNIQVNLDKTVTLFQKLFSVLGEPTKILLDPESRTLEERGINFYNKDVIDKGMDYDLILYPMIHNELKASNAEAGN